MELETDVNDFNSNKQVMRQEVINFKRRRISENDQDLSQIEGDVICIDTDTALETETLTIEIAENNEEEVVVEDNSEEYIEENGYHFEQGIVGEVVEKEDFISDYYAKDVDDDEEEEELEEGEIPGLNLSFLTRRFQRKNELEKVYDCPLCEKTFAQKGNLIRHYQTHTGAKPFACSMCGHKFTQKSNLQKHIATHMGVKKFECGVCQKTFVQKANLIRHLRIHTGEKPFQCNLCGHRFTQKGNLNKHMQLHSSDIVSNCDFCGHSFNSYAAKAKHELSTHGDLIKQNDDSSEGTMSMKDFRCNECPAKFRNEKCLKKHKKYHE